MVKFTYVPTKVPSQYHRWRSSGSGPHKPVGKKKHEESATNPGSSSVNPRLGISGIHRDEMEPRCQGKLAIQLRIANMVVLLSRKRDFTSKRPCFVRQNSLRCCACPQMACCTGSGRSEELPIMHP